MLAQIADMVELVGLQIGDDRVDVGQAASLNMSAVMSSTEQSAIS